VSSISISLSESSRPLWSACAAHQCALWRSLRECRKKFSDRVNGKWAGKEHLGHLADLDALDHARLKEFLNGSAIMSPADMRNRATEEARHRDKPVGEILLPMRTGRLALVSKLEQLTDEQVALAMLHPRLQKRMRLVDWIWFIAEHDDHHLAHTRRCILQQIGR
jgi:hypothetical protein